MTDLSMESTTTSTLDDASSVIVKAIAGGHLPSVAEAIVKQTELADMIFQLFLDRIQSECTHINRRTTPVSPFLRVDADKCATFQWKTFIDDLSLKAPTLLHVLSSIVSYSDHRNKKANSAHHPGLCMTVAILLKERNREICGVHSLLSLLYSSHVDKQVGNCEIKKSFIV